MPRFISEIDRQYNRPKESINIYNSLFVLTHPWHLLRRKDRFKEKSRLSTKTTPFEGKKVDKPESEIYFSVQSWQEVLERYPGFSPKEVQKAAILMANFSQGARDTYNYYINEKSLTNFSIPKISLSFDPSDRVCFDVDTGEVVVGIRYIRKISQNIFRLGRWEIPYTFRSSSDKKVLFKGTLPHMFYFSAVEEFDHAAYLHQHPEDRKGRILDSSKTSSAQYDAQPHEYRSLQTRILFAERKGLQKIAGVFKNRLTNADGYLASHK